MSEFKAKLNEYQQLIEGSLAGYMPCADETPQVLRDSMVYSLLGGGKRIRAILVLAFYEMFSHKNPAKALPFAAAVEMIHAYSLIHDDLPCMDNADLRRGKAANHIEFGEANALLAGDALLTLAFETMCKAEGFNSTEVCGAIQSLAKAAGATGMVGGQVMDLQNEGKSVNEDTLIKTDSKKTGALIRSSVEMGCILAGASPNDIQKSLEYAAGLGLAFQVIDDILDETSNPQILGKPVGGDESKQKSTYVSVYGVENARVKAQELTSSAVKAIKSTKADCGFLVELVSYLCERTY